MLTCFRPLSLAVYCLGVDVSRLALFSENVSFRNWITCLFVLEPYLTGCVDRLAACKRFYISSSNLDLVFMLNVGFGRFVGFGWEVQF